MYQLRYHIHTLGEASEQAQDVCFATEIFRDRLLSVIVRQNLAEAQDGSRLLSVLEQFTNDRIHDWRDMLLPAQSIVFLLAKHLSEYESGKLDGFVVCIRDLREQQCHYYLSGDCGLAIVTKQETELVEASQQQPESTANSGVRNHKLDRDDVLVAMSGQGNEVLCHSLQSLRGADPRSALDKLEDDSEVSKRLLVTLWSVPDKDRGTDLDPLLAEEVHLQVNRLLGSAAIGSQPSPVEAELLEHLRRVPQIKKVLAEEILDELRNKPAPVDPESLEPIEKRCRDLQDQIQDQTQQIQKLSQRILLLETPPDPELSKSYSEKDKQPTLEPEQPPPKKKSGPGWGWVFLILLLAAVGLVTWKVDIVGYWTLRNRAMAAAEDGDFRVAAALLDEAAVLEPHLQWYDERLLAQYKILAEIKKKTPPEPEPPVVDQVYEPVDMSPLVLSLMGITEKTYTEEARCLEQAIRTMPAPNLPLRETFYLKDCRINGYKTFELLIEEGETWFLKKPLPADRLTIIWMEVFLGLDEIDGKPNRTLERRFKSRFGPVIKNWNRLHSAVMDEDLSRVDDLVLKLFEMNRGSYEQDLLVLARSLQSAAPYDLSHTVDTHGHTKIEVVLQRDINGVVVPTPIGKWLESNRFKDLIFSDLGLELRLIWLARKWMLPSSAGEQDELLEQQLQRFVGQKAEDVFQLAVAGNSP